MHWRAGAPARGPQFIDLPKLGASPKRPGRGFTRLFMASTGNPTSLEDDGTQVDLTAPPVGSVALVGCQVVKSALQTLTTGVEAAVVWDGTDVFDTDAMHDPASNNTRMTIATGRMNLPKAGLYTAKPSTADSTEIAGVIMLSP